MADSKELQTQLQINQQINKVLADRSAQMSGLQKQLTSQTQLAVELCKALECKDLEGLQDRIDGLNESFKAAADGAQELGSAQAAASQEMADGLDNAREKSGGLLDKISAVKAGAVAGGAGFMKAFSGVGGMLKMVGGGLMSVVGNLFSVGKAIFAVPFKMLGGLVSMAASGGGGTDQLREAMEDLKEEMGDLSTGAGAAVMDSFDQLRSSGGALAQTGLSMTKVFGPGKEGAAAALKAVGEIAKAAGGNLDMITEQLKEAGDAAVMMNKGLGMSNEALAEMMRQAKNSGTSARDEMIEMGSMAIQMGDKFGVSAKSIGKNVSKLIEDVENFGGMSKKQLTATATYMAKLGLEAKDLQGVISKFDDFESAADGVSQLNQAFGIQLDTMEMMNAQNPAERIDMMRDAFHSAGKSVEDMTRAEKKLMAEQMGLSVSAMENALATENMGVSYEDMEGAAEEAEANKMSEKEVMLELAKSIKTLTQSGSGVTGFFDAFKKGFSQGFAKAKGFRELMQAIRKSLKVVFNFGKKFGKMVGDLLGKLGLFKSLKKLFDPAVFEKFFGKALGYFQKFFDAITGKGDYSAAQLLEDLTSEFMATFGKAGGEAASGFKTFFIKMIEIAGDVLASALPWLIEKFANIIQGIADFLADPSAAMNAAKGATEGIGGAFATAFGKIGKALKPVLPKLGAAFKSLFSELFKIIKPFLIKAFIAVVALSAIKGIAVGLIKGAGTAAILGAIKFLAKKMGITMAASTSKEMKKGAKKGAKGGMFKSMGKMVKEIGKMDKKDIIKAGVTLFALAAMFTGGMVMFAIGVRIAFEILKKVDFAGLAKVLIVTAAGLAGTYVVAKIAGKMNPAATLKAIPGLLAAAALFAVGMVAFAGGVWLANKILAKVKWKDFTKILGIVAVSMVATVGMAIAGAAFFALASAIPAMIVGLVAAAGLFTAGILIFGGAVLATSKVLGALAAKEKTINSALGSLIEVVKTIGLMGVLGAVFAAIGIFVPILVAGFGVAAYFFEKTVPKIEKMVKMIMKIPMSDPKALGERVGIVAKLAKAMQSIADIGLKAGKLALVAEHLKPGGMEIMFKNIAALISQVADTMITLIGMIMYMGSNLTPGQGKNVEIIGNAINAIANLASALMSPLEAVAKMSSGLFSGSVSDIMAAVATGLVNIMEKIRTALPSLVAQIIFIADKLVKDPKTLKPKMEIIAGAMGAVGNFAKAIEAVAELMPEAGGGFFSKGKDMETRIAEMTDIIAGVVDAVKNNIQDLVDAILTITIANPEEALKKVGVIEKAMSATAKFAGVVEKLTGMGSLDRIDETIMTIVKEMTSALIKPPGSLQELFDSLAIFAPDEALLPKLDSAVATLDKMAAFTKAMVRLNEAGGDNMAMLGIGVMAIVEQAKLAITALNSIGELNAEVALGNFAQAIGTGDGEFTISNEPININLNVKVVMDAGRITRVITDKTQMIASGGPTVAAAE